MTNYTRGRSWEYKVKHKLESQGWYVVRSAGSHSIADLIAIRSGRVVLIQCKIKQLTRKEREQFEKKCYDLGVKGALYVREDTWFDL